MVKDLTRAISFYRDVLQLPLAPTIGEKGAEFDLPDGSTFELWSAAEASWPWERGHGIMFAVADASDAVAELRSHGVTIGDPWITPRVSWHSARILRETNSLSTSASVSSLRTPRRRGRPSSGDYRDKRYGFGAGVAYIIDP